MTRNSPRIAVAYPPWPPSIPLSFISPSRHNIGMVLKERQQAHIEHLRTIGLGGLLFANHTTTGGFSHWTSEPRYPVDYRSIFANEIVIEADAPDAEENARITRKISEMLEKDLVPHQMFDSGGKGFHLHVFFNACFDGLESLMRQAETYGMSYDNLRYDLFCYLLDLANLTERERKLIDEKCVKFNACDGESKGRLIRAVGGRKFSQEGVFYKTFVTEIKKVKVSLSYDVRFPPEPALWRVPRFVLRNILQQEIAWRKHRQNAPERTFDGDYLSLKCIQRLLDKGIAEPNRNMGAQILATACYLDGLKREEAEVLMRRYASKCKGNSQFSYREGMAWFDSAMGRISYFGWCQTALKLGLCKKSECRFYGKYITKVSN